MRMLRRCLAAIASALTAAAIAQAAGMPPVARVGHVDGAAEFSSAAAEHWHRVIANRPLTAGDRLRLSGGHAELRFAGGIARIEGPALLALLADHGGATRLRLERGKLHLRWREGRLSVDSPNLRLVVMRPGELRIDVDDLADGTRVLAINVDAIAYGTTYGKRALRAGERLCFGGHDLSPLPTCHPFSSDRFGRWVAARERLQGWGRARRELSHRLIGSGELDGNGIWREQPGYGTVWVPLQVAADWAPFGNGDWEWIPGWGWTWIGAEPWSFATHHYGRWLQFEGFWGWQPDADDALTDFRPERVAAVGRAQADEIAPQDIAPAPTAVAPITTRAPPPAMAVPPVTGPRPLAVVPLTIPAALRPVVVIEVEARHHHRRHHRHLRHERQRHAVPGFGKPGRAAGLHRRPLLRHIDPMQPVLVPPRKPVGGRLSAIGPHGRLISGPTTAAQHLFVDRARIESGQHRHERHRMGRRGTRSADEAHHVGRHFARSRIERGGMPSGRWRGSGRANVIRWRR